MLDELDWQQMPDAELVGRTLSADDDAKRAEAFTAIFARYHRMVLAYCGGRLQDPHAAADAAAETFAQAFIALETLRDPGSLRQWLFGIAKNRCLQEWERRHRQTPMPDPEQADNSDDEAGAYERASKARHAQVDRMLDTVAASFTIKQREVFRYAIRDGLTGQELAGQLGTSSEQASRLAYEIVTTAYQGFGALILAKEGRPYCPDLALILDQAAFTSDDAFTAKLRRRILRHLDTCENCGNCSTCQTQRARLIAPYAPAVIPILILPTVQARINAVLNHHADSQPPATTRQPPPPPTAAGEQTALADHAQQETGGTQPPAPTPARLLSTTRPRGSATRLSLTTPGKKAAAAVVAIAAVIAAILIGVHLAAGPTAATPHSPSSLAGSWTDASGNVLQITATGPDSYFGQVVRNVNDCTPINLQATGSSGHYTGTIAFYTVPGCTPFIGNGAITIDVAPDGATAQITEVSPSSGTCENCAPTTWTRNGSPG